MTENMDLDILAMKHGVDVDWVKRSREVTAEEAINTTYHYGSMAHEDVEQVIKDLLVNFVISRRVGGGDLS